MWLAFVMAIVLQPGATEGVSLPAAPAPLHVEVHLGEDIGQPLGTLFEARDASGRLVAGAGFAEVFSTYVRDNPRMLSFFMRSPEAPVTVEPLGKPFDCARNGARLLVQGNRLLSFHYFLSRAPFFQLLGGAWAESTVAGLPEGQGFGGWQPLGQRALTMHDTGVLYGEEVLLSSPEPVQVYYTCGRLFVYRAAPPRVSVIAWKPGDPIPVDLEAAPAFAVDGAGFPFAWGTRGSEVWFVTNIGTVYVHREGAYEIVRQSDGSSWQGYTTARVYDDLLIGQYPTGSLFVYNDAGLHPFAPALPVPENAHASARELQTLAFYCGDLYAGVWPWGEPWRLELDTRQWQFVARLFETPPMSNAITAPYEVEMAAGEVYNLWGQRITSLTPFGDALYAATFSKQGKPYLPGEHGFLRPEDLAQYGALHRIKAGYQVAAEIAWRVDTRLTFECGEGRLAVYQDGSLLALTHLPEGLSLKDVQFRWGDGLYGPFAGTLRPQD